MTAACRIMVEKSLREKSEQGKPTKKNLLQLKNWVDSSFSVSILRSALQLYSSIFGREIGNRSQPLILMGNKLAFLTF